MVRISKEPGHDHRPDKSYVGGGRPIRVKMHGNTMNGRFIACDYGVQLALEAVILSERVYCTQQIGVLTPGMTLRAIHAVEAA
jgi:hypothetical protein